MQTTMMINKIIPSVDYYCVLKSFDNAYLEPFNRNSIKVPKIYSTGYKTLGTSPMFLSFPDENRIMSNLSVRLKLKISPTALPLNRWERECVDNGVGKGTKYSSYQSFGNDNLSSIVLTLHSWVLFLQLCKSLRQF